MRRSLHGCVIQFCYSVSAARIDQAGVLDTGAAGLAKEKEEK